MNTAALRTLIIYAIILPLAVFVGWLMSEGEYISRGSFTLLAGIVFVLFLPALLKWHYLALIFSWNTFITIFFIPGKPAMWMLMAGINFGIALFHRIILKRQAFISAPSITISLLALGAVVLITAQLRGGVGLQILGSSTYGGRGYYYLAAAIIGYFALVTQSIPHQKAKWYAALFLLPGVVSGISTLIYYAGPGFYFLYVLFPSGFAGTQAMSEVTGGIVRVAGFTTMSTFVIWYLLAVYGVRGLLTNWWRLLLFMVVFVMGAMGGYRSLVVIIGLTCLLLFALEGLFRSALFPAVLLAGGLAFAAMIPFGPKLPYSIQRTLSVLPVKVNPIAKEDARGSTEWRLEIWRALVPDLPKYFWLGKGYVLNPTDMYLVQQASLRGRARNYEGALLVGDYHSGPLSVYMPFGIFGSLAFLAFIVVSLRALYLNYRYGSEEVRMLNRFLFAFFLARAIFFFAIFGAISAELYVFTGIVGFSVALNKGICRRPAPAPRPVRFRGNLELGRVQPGAA